LRVASVLFALFAGVLVLGNVDYRWMLGGPLRFTLTPLTVGTVVSFIVLSAFLWRRHRWVATVGLIVSLADLTLVSGATYFLWPYLRRCMDQPQQIYYVVVSMVLPIVLGATIAITLVRVLLSNNRWSDRDA
jgi:hypothetical protein